MATISNQGSIRAALAALYANGGFQVILRMPGTAVSGSDAEQLGLSTPQFQDLPLGPAVWREVGVNSAIVLAASAVENILGLQEFSSVDSIFQSAVGVVVDGTVYVIRKTEPLLMAGVACAYRLSVQAPAGL